MKLRNRSNQYSASKGASTFTPDSSSTKEEDEEGEEEDEDEIELPAKKKATKDTPPKPSCDLNRTTSSTRSPTITAQPKKETLQEKDPKEQGANSSTTSAAQTVQLKEPNLQEQSLEVQDSQKVKFEAEIDLSLIKMVKSNTGDKNLNLSLFKSKASYDPFKKETVRPRIESKLEYPRFAGDAHEFAGLKNLDQSFSGILTSFRLTGKNEDIDGTGVSSFSFASGLLYKDTESPYGLRMEPGALETDSIIQPMIKALSEIENYLELKTNMGALSVFENNVAKSLEQLKVSTKGKNKLETLTCVKPLTTATSTFPTNGTENSISSTTTKSGAAVVTTSSTSSSSSSHSLTSTEADALLSSRTDSSSSLPSPKTTPRQRQTNASPASSSSKTNNSGLSKIDTPHQPNPPATIYTVSSTVADSVGKLQAEDGKCCRDDDIVFVSISVQTLRLLGAHLVSITSSDGETKAIFLTNNTQHVILHGLHTGTTSKERIDLSLYLEAKAYN